MNPNQPIWPRRPDTGTQALITAAAAFPALEEMVLSAEEEILLAFRIFDPDTGLRSMASQTQGLETWGGLIRQKIDQGVKVKLLLTDFDAIAGNALHKLTWASLAGFKTAVSGSRHEDNFSSVAALHEAEFGTVTRLLFWPLARGKLKAVKPDKSAGDAQSGGPPQVISETPGLRAYFRRTLRTADGLPLWPPPRMWPATYHQKYAVIDHHHLFIGGLDFNERRFDDPDHSRPSEQTWHDVSVRSDGLVARDARQFFVQNWNREVARYNSRLTALGAPQPDLPLPAAPMPADRQAEQEDVVSPASDHVRFVVTRSRKSRSSFALGPRSELRQIEEAQFELFGSARDLIYIETQFLRSLPLARQLAAAGRTNRELKLIALLPAAPDDIAFDANRGADARHGEYLQARALDIINETFGDRAAFYCLVKNTAKQERNERDAVDGRAIAYLHSKITIADGETAIVSSANLNGRSLRWDTEAGLLWRNPNRVAKFQEDIWQAHLRDGFVPAAMNNAEAAFSMWRTAGQSGQQAGMDRPPQITEYPLDRARSFGKRMWFIPNNMI